MEQSSVRHGRRRRFAFAAFRGSAIALGVGLVASAGCISPTSDLLQGTAQGCDEFQPGTDVDASLQVDAKVKTFMQAASDFVKHGDVIKGDVVTACTNIAKDLGAQDTWTGLQSADDRISNESGTGACDQAGSRVEDILVAAGKVNANVAIAVSRGECHLDFDEEKKCDESCAANATCDAGTCETRCDPAKLSVECETTCEAGATCVGTADAPANCMGKCEAECQGSCKGTCIGEDGTKTTDNPNCRGKCSSSCNGTCRGMCKIDASEGVQCGANVRCTGGCSGSYTSPVCTTQYTPPKCTVDQDCLAACHAKVVEDAVCDPTQVDVFANVDASPDVAKLVQTLKKNLPPLFDAANQQGKLVLAAAGRLGDSGHSLSDNVENLDGKSLACLGAASTAVGKEIGSLDVSVNASVNVTTTVTEHSE